MKGQVSSTGTGTDHRCSWCGEHADYIAYHDQEWGLPRADRQRLFEKICLEGFQAGLSWLTILRKRENFRNAFYRFEPARVATMTSSDVERLLKDAGIIRHRGKIESAINNAQRVPALEEEFGSLGAFVWSFEPAKEDRPRTVTPKVVSELTKTEASTAMSKALKKRGWSFVGPTTMYAFMQSCGVVNDHIERCAWRKTCEQARTEFVRPPLPST